jgi:RNA polymerase sigma-70 factor, ECF subfamily
MDVEDQTDNWQLIHDGNKAAFEKLFKDYYDPLCGYAYTIVKDWDESDEVIQNVFFNIWNKRQTLQVNVPLKAYLYRAVHNECLNKLKHAKVKLAYAADYKHKFSTVKVSDSASHIDAKELERVIQQVLDALPDQCCKVFKLSRFENLTYPEISVKLGISVKTVESHMGKALKSMRTNLKEYLSLLICLLYSNQ